MKRNIISCLVLIISLLFFVAANSIDKKSSRRSGNCFNCGTASACEVGGENFGWTGCWYNPENGPPLNCNVYGSNGCKALAPVDG